jgi:hypothetical protein
MRSRPTGAAASTAAVACDRTRSTPGARVREHLPGELQRGAHRTVRSYVSDGPISCPRGQRLHIPDASLSAAGAPARLAAGRRGNTRLGACADSAHPPDATTHDGKSANTRRRSRCCRGRSAGRSEPAPRSGGSCRAGSSARAAAPMPPPQALDSAGQGRHKESAKRLAYRRWAPRARGSDVNRESRAFVYLWVRRQHSGRTAERRLVAPAQIIAALVLTPSAAAWRQTGLRLCR